MASTKTTKAPELKVGTRVRLLRKSRRGAIPAGTIGTVAAVRANGDITVDFPHRLRFDTLHGATAWGTWTCLYPAGMRLPLAVV
jgi:hypothetical protein